MNTAAAHSARSVGAERAGTRELAICGLCLIAALYVVGFASHTIVRHIVQTIPVWIAVVLGIRHSRWSKWTSLPCFGIWLFLMLVIWSFLLGWAHVISGHFSATEIAMTVLIGISCLVGIITALKMKTGSRPMFASVVFLGFLLLQIAALRISFLPAIASR